MTAAETWEKSLKNWAIPQEILEKAQDNPWIHPPILFKVPEKIEVTPSHIKAKEVLADGDSVLDIGCGGGVAAFACVPPAGIVFGVDHQQEMLDLFSQEANKRAVAHGEFLGDWPNLEKSVPSADVVTCHHVVYNVSDIAKFLMALDSHAKKRVVIEMPQSHPLSAMTASWKHFWNIDRPKEPTPETLILVLAELGIKANVEYWEIPIKNQINFEQAADFMRIRLCLPKSRLDDVKEFMKSNPEPQMRKLATIWWDK